MSVIPGVTDSGPLKGFSYDQRSGAFICNSGNDRSRALQRRISLLEDKVKVLEEKLDAIITGIGNTNEADINTEI